MPIGNNADDEIVQAGMDEDLDALDEAQIDLAEMNVVDDDDDGNNFADERVQIQMDIEAYKLTVRAIQRALEAIQSEEPKETTEVQQERPRVACKPKAYQKLQAYQKQEGDAACSKQVTEEELLSDKQEEAMLGNRTEKVEFKVQQNSYYKYEKRMPAYSKRTEEEQAMAYGAPGYFSLVTSGGKARPAAGGPRVGIPIQEFRELEDDPIIGRLPRKEETPYEVHPQPAARDTLTSEPDLLTC